MPRRPVLRAPASLRGRVTLTVLGLLAVLLVLLFTAVDLVLGARLHADLRTRLTDRAALAQQLDASVTSQQLVDQLRGEGVTVQLCTYGAGCVTADPAPAPPGAPAAQPGTQTGTRPGSGPATRPGRPPAPRQAATVQSSGSVLYVRTQLPDGQLLTLSVDAGTVSTALSRLVVLEVVGGLLALLLAGLLLGRLVGAALQPLDRMTGLARDIAGGDRGRRLGTGSGETELGRTAAAFDAMLDELEAALGSAEAAQDRMRQFLSDASHELRTPLAGLQATVENLLRRDPGRLERERALAAMARETGRAGRLVDDLLTVSRADGDLGLRLEPTDLAALARTEVERYRLLAPQLSWCTDGESALTVPADPGRLGQVLSNLLDNARHATPAGGQVRVTTGRDGGLATWEVADTGTGIATADRARVFDRLVRLDAARTSGGAGLGLPIARAIARAHGGDLVALPADRGARFRVSLPAA